MLAELWGTPARRQASYAWGALVTVPGDDGRGPPPGPGGRDPAPLACRLRLRHRWHVVSAEDGSSHWRECVHCGRVQEPPGHNGLMLGPTW